MTCCHLDQLSKKVKMEELFSDSNEKLTNNGLNCVLLSDCPSVLSVISAILADQLADKTTLEVFDFLRLISCGYQGSEALINCPATL